MFFFTPAPLPAHDEQLAPAFVVVIFENFFQTQGSLKRLLDSDYQYFDSFIITFFDFQSR